MKFSHIVYCVSSLVLSAATPLIITHSAPAGTVQGSVGQGALPAMPHAHIQTNKGVTTIAPTNNALANALPPPTLQRVEGKVAASNELNAVVRGKMASSLHHQIAVRAAELRRKRKEDFERRQNIARAFAKEFGVVGFQPAGQPSTNLNANHPPHPALKPAKSHDSFLAKHKTPVATSVNAVDHAPGAPVVSHAPIQTATPAKHLQPVNPSHQAGEVVPPNSPNMNSIGVKAATISLAELQAARNNMTNKPQPAITGLENGRALANSQKATNVPGATKSVRVV